MPVLPTRGVPFESARLSRRGFIAAGIAGGFALAGCSQSTTGATKGTSQMADAIAAVEAIAVRSTPPASARRQFFSAGNSITTAIQSW